METQAKTNRPWMRGAGIGVILVIIGFILMGLNFGWIHPAYRGLIFSWQALIILIGLIHLTRRRQIIWGSIYIVVGSFFLIPKMVRAFPEYFPTGISDQFTALYWPLLMIVAGLLIILNKFIFPAHKWKSDLQHQCANYQTKTYSSSGKFEKNSIFGAGEHIFLDAEFQGGEANAIFGGITLDLRRTTLPVGETKLEINAVFGGFTLLIPSDWNVDSRIDAIFGGFEDKRRVIEPVNPERKLIIVGSCVFGGGDIVS